MHSPLHFKYSSVLISPRVNHFLVVHRHYSVLKVEIKETPFNLGLKKKNNNNSFFYRSKIELGWLSLVSEEIRTSFPTFSVFNHPKSRCVFVILNLLI